MAKMTRKELLNLVTSGEIVDLTFKTAREADSSGGRRITETNLQICGSRHSDREHGTFTVKQVGKAKAHPITVHLDLVEFANGIEVI
jgi:hypothetical protein